MDAFLRAYLETALWSSTDEQGQPLDANYGVDDIAEESVRNAAVDCLAFREDNAADLASVGRGRGEWTDMEGHAHDFWLTRNGHGAGFWDRGYGAVGERLTVAAHVWGPSDVYVGDDGKVYLT